MQITSPDAVRFRWAVLVTSDEESDRNFLSAALQSSGVETRAAFTCRDALQNLKDHPACAIVSETALPDGDWRDLLAHLRGFRTPPYLIVTSRTAGERLWAEVPDAGGYDVLAKLFDRNEVVRVVVSACRNHEQQTPQTAAGEEQWHM